MSKIIMLRAASSRRQQPLLQASRRARAKASPATRLGEVVGGATAVCCCFPCGLANIMFHAVYKLPVSLCRRVLQSRKQHRRQRLATSKDGEVMYSGSRRRCGYNCDCEDFGVRIHPNCDEWLDEVKIGGLKEEDKKEVEELEKEMWEIFYETGFWRSCSQREGSSSSSSPFSSFSSSSSSSPQGMLI